jgi:uncharacterized protein YkwD
MVLPVANTLVNTNLDNTAYAEETSETINNMSFDEYESQVNTMIALVNTYRVSNGLEPYKVSPKLMEIAKQRASEEESTGVSHQRPDGTKWSTIFDEYGVSCYNIEENVGGGSLVLAGVPSTMLDYWKQSEGHNANILSSCEYIGVGVDYYDGLCYWSQIFCNSDDSQISDGAYILVSATDDEDTTITATMMGCVGTYGVWDASCSTEITGDGQYSLEWNLDSATEAKEGSGAIFIDTNIDPYDFLPAGYSNTGKADIAKDTGITLSVDSVEVDGVEIAYNGPSDDAYVCESDYDGNNSRLRLNVYNMWGSDVDDIDFNFAVESSIKVTFSVTGLDEARGYTTSEPVTTTTTTAPVANTSIPTENYDINGDGKVNFIDLILLKKKILEMI